MNHRSPKAHSSLICLLVISAATWLLQPSVVLAAKTLASGALATAIENGTLDQVRQEMLMDLHQKQRFDFDEKGMEELGRNLVAQGQMKQGVEILQLNQMIHLDSPRAANALGDVYRDSGDDISARVYYDMALNLDPENAHAKKATAGQGDPQELAMEAIANAGGMGDWEMDPEAMAQMGVELSPEQMKEMQDAMAQMEAYHQDPSAYQAPKQPVSTKQPRKGSAPAEPRYESEFCEVLHRFNADKKIPDAQVRSRVEGNYGSPGNTMRTWNVETTCGEFLVAVPLWADVSPPVMTPTSGDTFEDAMGGTWTFRMDGEGKASEVTYLSSDGTVSEMKRLGDPLSYN